MSLQLEPGEFQCSPEVRSVIVPVHGLELPAEVQKGILQEGFTPKQEHHITVVAREIGSKLTTEQFTELSDLAAGISVGSASADTCLYLIAKEKEYEGAIYHRQALVMPCVLTGVAGLLAAAAQQGITLPEPFTHITTHSQGDEALPFKGIGIVDAAEWHNLQPTEYVRW